MSDNNNLDLSDIICSCSGTTYDKVQKLISERGISSLEQISRITGACSGCGACDVLILEVLESNLKGT